MPKNLLTCLKPDASINFSMYTQEVVSDKNNGCFLSKMVTMSFVTEILRGYTIKPSFYPGNPH